MDKQQETQNTWNNIAAIYNDKFLDLPLYNDTYDFICEAITRQNAKILDVGCGPGNITKYLLHKRPDLDVLGIDLAPKMIEFARKNNPTARFKVMDSRDIHLLDSKFDAIVVGFCLPYLSPEEAIAFIKSAYGQLNDQGLLYLSFVEGDPAQSDFKVGSGGRVYFYYHLLEELKLNLQHAHFSQLALFKVAYKVSESSSDVHTILILRKDGVQL